MQTIYGRLYQIDRATRQPMYWMHSDLLRLTYNRIRLVSVEHVGGRRQPFGVNWFCLELLDHQDFLRKSPAELESEALAHNRAELMRILQRGREVMSA